MSYEHGYLTNIDEIRAKEYSGILGDEVYLDHAGSAVYAKSLVEKSSQALLSGLYGNPHSKSSSSERTSAMVHSTRLKVLKMLNADPTEYSVVFTANATNAVKLIGESLSKDMKYWYLRDSHTSLIGLRNLVGEYRVVDDMEDVICGDEDERIHLASWPGQSNFSGKRYPMGWAKRLKDKQKNIYTLLDAAAMSSTKPPDLSQADLDFVVLSFYKIFGLPDLGALVVKKDSGSSFFSDNQRTYFGGGTVESLTVETDFSPRHQSISSSLEDGTLPFHSILSLSIAFEVHENIYNGGFETVSKHTAALSHYLYNELWNLKYPNGKRLCVLYSDGTYLDTSVQGPIVAFNLKDANGKWIGYSDFDGIASSNKINIRTGTLCNTGSTAKYLGISEQRIVDNHSKGHICGDDDDVIDGVPTGVIRVSLGACSNKADVDALLSCLKEYYLGINTQDYASTTNGVADKHFISDITLFPIKSCGAFHVPRGVTWELSLEGLKWDREFCLVDRSNYSVLALKKHPHMARIRPFIDEKTKTMQVNVEGQRKPLSVPMNAEPQSHPDIVSSRIMGESVKIVLYTSPEVIDFFSEAVGLDCTLARFPKEGEADILTTRFHKPHLNGPLNYNREKEPDTTIPISMNNSSPLLLISKPSAFKLALDNDLDSIDPNIFRGNIVISGKNLPPYAEDGWNGLIINHAAFRLLGPCRRCHMVSVDAKTGLVNSEPYLALHKTRKINGKLLFGQHMTLEQNQGPISIKLGDPVKSR